MKKARQRRAFPFASAGAQTFITDTARAFR